MQTAQKIRYLKAMGIEVFRDRLAQTLAPQVFHLLHLRGLKPIFILADLDEAKCEEEQNLLEAIAKALGFQAQAETISENNLNSKISAEAEIIAMGNIISSEMKKQFPKKNIITTFSPSELIENPKLKAQTWNAIRDLKQNAGSH
jgi:hypothetical protein